MKRCGRCHQQLDESMFSKNKRTKDGLRCYCRKCGSEKTKEYHMKNVTKNIPIKLVEKETIKKLPQWMQQKYS